MNLEETWRSDAAAEAELTSLIKSARKSKQAEMAVQNRTDSPTAMVMMEEDEMDSSQEALDFIGTLGDDVVVASRQLIVRVYLLARAKCAAV